MGYFRDSIEKMAGYTPGLQPSSTDVVKLNTNENPYPPSPNVLAAIRAIHPERLRRYPEPLGDRFRNVASQVLEVRPENIICTNGGDELLSICVRAFCDAARPVAFAQPTYSLYPVLAEIHGCETIQLNRINNWLDDLAKVNAPLTIVCNPNAPTADFVPIEELAQLAEKLDGVLLIDEAYVDFARDNGIRLIKEHDNVIILRSLSKGYSLAGLRFGCGIAQPELIKGLIKVKDSYNVNAVSLAAAAAAIADQTYFRLNVEQILAERGILTEALRLMGFEVEDSETNFVLAKCVQAPAAKIYKELAQRSIFVRYFDLPDLQDKLRITVGTNEQNKKLIKALQEILSMEGISK